MASSSAGPFLLPAPHHHVTAADVDRDHDRARRTPRRRAATNRVSAAAAVPRIAPRGAGLEQRGDRPPSSGALRPPAREPATARQIASTTSRLFALVERGIQVDDVQPASALLLEAHGHLDGIARSSRSRSWGRPATAGRRGHRAGRSRGSRSCRHRLHEALVHGEARRLRTSPGGTASRTRCPSRPTAANGRPYVVTPTVVAASTSGANECTK